MEKLVEGVKKFQTEVFRAKRELFSRLSESQAPRALFITCSDSRIDPTLLTQAEPGELFILRNAGNIVPSYGETMGGSTATIEYAVALLGVKHVIVCGHTDCGVMSALLHPESVEDLPAVKNWMIQAETTRRIVRDNYADLKGEELLVTTIQENVRIQLDHLRTHPAVAVRLRRGTLALHGWVYSIPTGDIWAYDESKDVFVSLK
ncbi:MAG: carbonic anhydrase [Nitrospira sp.]|nr:MAG: carbonic anhydrase [Nitrospira sp.]